jgi:integrase
MARRSTERAKFGAEAEQLTAEDRLDTAKAKALLDPHGATVREAAQFFADYLSRTAKSATITELRDQFIEAKRADGRGSRYLGDLRSRLGRFSEDYAETKVAAITGPEVDDWLRALPLSPVSRNNFRTVLHGLFAFAVARGYRTDNPVAGTAKAKVVRKAPEIFTPAQLRSLLANADGRIVPAIAIGAFAGLRRAEIDRLDWSEIDLAAGYIEVKGSKSKSGARRLVKITPNLHAWLTPHARKSGLVRDLKERDLLPTARKDAKLEKWPDNGLRHSFASYHLAHFKNAAALALELGHTTSDLIFSNYRELVRPEVAAEWWEITPAAQAGNMVPFAAAGHG